MSGVERLKVTGLGAVSAAGTTSASLWGAMNGSTTTASVIDDPHLLAPVRQMFLASARPVLEHSAAEFGVAAAEEALASAVENGFDPTAARLAVIVGTGMGEASASEARRSAGHDGSDSDSIFTTASRIAKAIGATGVVSSVSNACAASAYAVGQAADLLLLGEVDAVLVVGAEAYSRVAVASFNRMNALDPDGCRPFTVDRAGTLFGEGAAAVLLERQSSPTQAMAWLTGAAFSCDAGHWTAPDSAGTQIRRAFDEAVESTSRRPVDAVVPHGTGTQLNDAVEADLLEERLPDAAWFNLKALLGHTGGASAVLSLVAACLIAIHRFIPANPELGEVIASANKGLASAGRPIQGAVAVNAYAFGGNNATLIVEGT